MKYSRLTAALTLGFALVAGTANAEVKEVRMATEGAYAPFNYIDKDGKLGGFDVDIGNALCEEMKVKCEWVTSDWDAIIPGLLAKKFDAIVASMSITEERKKKVAFTGKYYNTPSRFFQEKGANIEISEAGLAGKTIGVQGATIQENLLNDKFASVADIKAYATQDEANLDLVNGRVDVVFVDAIVAEEFMKTDTGKNTEFTGPTFSDPKYFGDGAGVAVRQEDTELQKMLDDAIKAIRANGKYKEINDRYFSIDVYGAE